MNRKIVIMVSLVVVASIGLIGYLGLVNNVPHYTSREDCENKTGKQCYLFGGLCQVGEAQSQKEIEYSDKFLKECRLKIGTWQPIETTSRTVSDVSDWHIYRNDEYGFEIRYPFEFREMKIEDSDSKDHLLSVTSTDSICSYYLNVNLREDYQITNILSSVKDAKQINIGNDLGYAYFYTEGVGYSGVALVQIGQDQLSIEFDCIGNGSTPNNQGKGDIQDFFNQILSTFWLN